MDVECMRETKTATFPLTLFALREIRQRNKKQDSRVAILQDIDIVHHLDIFTEFFFVPPFHSQ